MMANNMIIIKLLIVLLIPVGIFFAKDYETEFLSSQESLFLNLTPVQNIERVVNENRAGVDMLKAYNPVLTDFDVLANVNPSNLNRYFLQPPPPPPPPPPVKIETTETVAPVVVVKPPTYNIDFIFDGESLKYVSIGNELLQVGDQTLEGEVIKNIENTRVQLQGRWGLRWISINF